MQKSRSFIIQGYKCLIKEANNTKSSFSINTRTLNFLKDSVTANTSIIVIDNVPDRFLLMTSKETIEERYFNLKQTLAEKLNLFIGDISVITTSNITSYDYLPCPGMIEKGLDLLEGRDTIISGIYATDSMKQALDKMNIESISVRDIEDTYADVTVKYPHDLQNILTQTNLSEKERDRQILKDLANYKYIEQQAVKGDNFIMFNQS